MTEKKCWSCQEGVEPGTVVCPRCGATSPGGKPPGYRRGAAELARPLVSRLGHAATAGFGLLAAAALVLTLCSTV
ncbi:MAG: hypothetical protein ACREKN_00455 [Longimicrobiaceae bacterium]